MKTNIKMRVMPEQLEKTCKIVGEGWLYLKSAIYMYIFNDGSVEVSYSKENWNKYNLREIDADLFIRTNGTCEENQAKKLLGKLEQIHDKEIYTANEFNNISLKLKKKNEILKKARIKRKNQREELNKLNLKLQKCIDLGAHNIATQKLRDTIVLIRDDVINQVDNITYNKNKEIEKLKVVIEYLESKVK